MKAEHAQHFGLALRRLTLVTRMNVVKGREQDAHALCGFTYALHRYKPLR